jgi:hypothetical protein
MSRHWHRVSRSIQKLAAGMYPIMSEGMSPYEMYYVLATDEEIRRLELNTTPVFTGPAETDVLLLSAAAGAFASPAK